MKVITHTIMHQRKLAGGQIESIMHTAKFAGRQIESIMYPAKFAGRQIESIMYPAKFAGGRSRLDLLLPSFLPSREEKKKQERIKQSIDSGAEWHTPFMRQGERDAVWREAFWEQRERVAIWRDSRLEEKSSHARLQLRISGENSKPYKSSLVALSEQLRDIFSA